MRIVGKVDTKRRVPEGPKRKLLRTYSRMAQQQHFCDRCNQNIEPGEMYEAEVWAVRVSAEVSAYAGCKRQFVQVYKMHVEPSCPEPDDEWILRELAEEEAALGEKSEAA